MNDAAINAAIAELDGWTNVVSDTPYWFDRDGACFTACLNYLDPERTHALRVMMEWRDADGYKWWVDDERAVVALHEPVRGPAPIEVRHDNTPASLTRAICEATLRAAGKWEGGE